MDMSFFSSDADPKVRETDIEKLRKERQATEKEEGQATVMLLAQDFWNAGVAIVVKTSTHDTETKEAFYDALSDEVSRTPGIYYVGGDFNARNPPC